jgi:hypothetical protein
VKAGKKFGASFRNSPTWSAPLSLKTYILSKLRFSDFGLNLPRSVISSLRSVSVDNSKDDSSVQQFSNKESPTELERMPTCAFASNLSLSYASSEKNSASEHILTSNGGRR